MIHRWPSYFILRLTMLLTMGIFAMPWAQAQTQRSGNETQKFMQQYQQLAAEKTALQAQTIQMKKDLDTAQADLAAVKKERDALKSRAGGSSAQFAQLTAGKEAAEKSLEQLKQKTTELVARFREMAVNLKEVEADRAKLQNDIKERSVAFDKCAEDNLGLFEVNGQILDRYEHIGVFTKVGTADPFTKIARTRIENFVDEYRARALELRAAKKSGP
jgi:DNA repair exonuclease SbcCD ATPase subunit